MAQRSFATANVVLTRIDGMTSIFISVWPWFRGM
jgi:hypothetical protein